MALYRITYADGSTNDIIGGENFCKEVTKDGGSYQLITPPDKTEEQLAHEARMWRDEELVSTDWVVPVTDHAQHAAYITYRKALRDWPSTSDFPDKRPTLG